MVTPHVGVWIETYVKDNMTDLYTVTPHVGVWIETWLYYGKSKENYVTPHVGVWIETYQEKQREGEEASHLM